MSASQSFEDLDVVVEQLPSPDLANPQSADAYRNGVLRAIVRQLQSLHLRPRDSALLLHTQIIKHTYALHAIGLIDDDWLTLGFADLRRAYEREQPGLLENVLHD